MPATLVSAAPADAPPRDAVVEVDEVHRRFGAVSALCGVSLRVQARTIHALLGANGAGKTTLLRVLAGLVEPTAGSARVLGRPIDASARTRAALGLVPSGDRTFYLRLSALENLIFFGRLHGLRLKAARARARDLLEAVGLAADADRPVSGFSHGMQKRLGFARVLLVDEATHDLDPVAAHGIRELTRERAAAGAAVIWATQRIEELTGFADHVTVLQEGEVRFGGSLTALAAHSRGMRYTLRVGVLPAADPESLEEALEGLASIEPAADRDPSHLVLTLAPGVSLGSAIACMARAGADVVACREERPPIEDAFLAIVGQPL